MYSKNVTFVEKCYEGCTSHLNVQKYGICGAEDISFSIEAVFM